MQMHLLNKVYRPHLTAGDTAVDMYGYGRVLWQIITGGAVGEGNFRPPR